MPLRVLQHQGSFGNALDRNPRTLIGLIPGVLVGLDMLLSYFLQLLFADNRERL